MNNDWISEAYIKYQNKLVCYADSIINDTHAANDVVSEVFIRLQKKGDVVKEYLPQWLHRVCKNISVDYINSSRRYVHTQDDETLGDEPVEDVYSYVAEEKAEDINKMMSCLNLITKKQQEMIRLRYFNNYSYQQISDKTGDKLGNVAFTLHAAIKKLREKMEEKYGHKCT